MLVKLPPQITVIPELRELDCSGNPTDMSAELELPPLWKFLDNLELLQINRCMLTTLPDGLRYIACMLHVCCIYFTCMHVAGHLCSVLLCVCCM